MNPEKRAKSAKCTKRVKSAQRSFFGPYGGKSDAADPFLDTPEVDFSDFDEQIEHVIKSTLD